MKPKMGKKATVEIVILDRHADRSALNAALNSSLADVVVLSGPEGSTNHRALSMLGTAFSDPEVAVAYSDESVSDKRGRHLRSIYKPDWSPERFRSQFYIGNLLAVRRTTALAAVLNSALDDSLPSLHGTALRWDLIFRLTENGGKVVHIPERLFGSADLTSVLGTEPASQFESVMLEATSVVQAHCNRMGIDAEVEISEPGDTLHLRRHPDSSTKVSLIIPTRGSSGTIWGQERVFIIELMQSIISKSTWENVEFVIVADATTPAIVRRALTQLCGDRLIWVDYDLPFNFSDKIAKGRAASNGQVLLLLNDDMEVVSEDFIEELIGLALDPGVGAVGARLLLADGRLQHIGHRYADGTFHLFAGYDGDYAGPENMCRITRECIGVTAACLAIRAEVFDEVGGMALDFPNNFNDVDFSLRLFERGLRNLVTPHAVLFHFESVTRDGTVTAEEEDLLFSRWGAQLNSDPYSNPNLESGRIEWLEKGAH
ncbi:MAG: glycosyltransferase [Actinobacteria bacterium]|uniref:Unannotated protein n=3 Tax=freshwater metagenome TaxID=449393 RepID=A0A6J6RGS7_9ZZZZ|nr:glycosyltransferase [Actinomycetota bacterium]MSY26083.1 glycosyltransferase [Actinomycetota bacterium]MTA42449.1 glycosyltransferase [Actinomycetota bacterium]